jgi:hypothetical protein
MFFRRLEARCVPSRLLVTEHQAAGHPVDISFPLFGSRDLHPMDCSQATPRTRLGILGNNCSAVMVPAWHAVPPHFHLYLPEAGLFHQIWESLYW